LIGDQEASKPAFGAEPHQVVLAPRGCRAIVAEQHPWPTVQPADLFGAQPWCRRSPGLCPTGAGCNGCGSSGWLPSPFDSGAGVGTPWIASFHRQFRQPFRGIFRAHSQPECTGHVRSGWASKLRCSGAHASQESLLVRAELLGAFRAAPGGLIGLIPIPASAGQMQN
jgi:hypothetical protein